MPTILVTGAAGFIGRALCPALAARGDRVVAGLRRTAGAQPPTAGVVPRILGDIAPGRAWSGELSDVDIVIHLAQRAHRAGGGRELAAEAPAAAALARAAAAAGVRRFVYVSSIKAMGEATTPGRPFCAADEPVPGDAYGHAKLATERALRAAAAGAGLDLVIVRPPLVYGPGVGANFAALVRLAASGVPLPLAAVDNRRSLIFRDNLVNLLVLCASHPTAAGRVWLAADGDDLSTPALLRLLASAQGRPARLFALPPPALALFRALPGVGSAFRRLTLSLQVDDRDTRAVLGWTPPVRSEAALVVTARALAAP